LLSAGWGYEDLFYWGFLPSIGRNFVNINSWWRERQEQRILKKFAETVAVNEDFWLWHIPEEIEWDVEEQSWAVHVHSMDDIIIPKGERVVVVRGRGGMREYARIVSGSGTRYMLSMEKG